MKGMHTLWLYFLDEETERTFLRHRWHFPAISATAMHFPVTSIMAITLVPLVGGLFCAWPVGQGTCGEQHE